jgi:hypothetical protein
MNAAQAVKMIVLAILSVALYVVAFELGATWWQFAICVILQFAIYASFFAFLAKHIKNGDRAHEAHIAVMFIIMAATALVSLPMAIAYALPAASGILLTTKYEWEQTAAAYQLLSSR